MRDGDAFLDHYVATVCGRLVQGLFDPLFGGHEISAMCRQARDVLLCECPRSVDEWARLLATTPRNLHLHCWRSCRVGPKTVLTLHTMVAAAFAHHLGRQARLPWKAPRLGAGGLKSMQRAWMLHQPLYEHLLGIPPQDGASLPFVGAVARSECGQG
jgi:hypothetical protein